MKQIERLVSAAELDLGYKESPPGSNLTKFGKWYGLDGNAWCMMAVQYWFNAADLAPLIQRTASCTELLNYAKNKQQFYSTGFKRGDIALFNWNGSKTLAQHVGIVTDVSGSVVHTIEGNTSVGNNSDGGEVMRRSRTALEIIGVFRPDYCEEEDNLTQEQFNRFMENYLAERVKSKVNQNLAPDEFAEAVKLGITDGTRPQSFTTRQETAVMALRASKHR